MKTVTYLALGLTLVFTSCGDLNTPEQTTSQEEPLVREVKVGIFNDPEETRVALSDNGIKALRIWRSDEAGGFISSSDYYEFGSNTAGIKNNLAYYLSSDNENYVTTLKLVLNINSKGEKRKALTKFKETVETTFRSLKLEMPKGLKEAITKEKDFKDDNEAFTTNLNLDRSNIDTWKLIIETK